MPQATYLIDHVTDGDTVVLRNGKRVRLVQIDTPEIFFGTECYGTQASATTKRLLPVGARVRLTAEPATDGVDDYGRLLRYVAKLPCPDCEAKLDAAIKAGAGKSELGELNTETMVLRNYFSWAGKTK
jgi:endonuclease YncB( thermonuclease family)